MKFRTTPRSVKGTRGQSLVEAALMIPIMLSVVLNALNLGYFLFVTINMTGTTRIAAEYAIVGPGSPGTTNYPSPTTGTTSVSSLIYQDMTGSVWNATGATVQICSPGTLNGTGAGTSGTPLLPNCVLCTSSSSCNAVSTGAAAAFVPSADPESPTFVSSRVDVQYSFPPLIPGTPFNLILMGNSYNSGTGQYTFYRHIEMRSM